MVVERSCCISFSRFCFQYKRLLVIIGCIFPIATAALPPLPTLPDSPSNYNTAPELSREMVPGGPFVEPLPPPGKRLDSIVSPTGVPLPPQETQPGVTTLIAPALNIETVPMPASSAPPLPPGDRLPVPEDFANIPAPQPPSISSNNNEESKEVKAQPVSPEIEPVPAAAPPLPPPPPMPTSAPLFPNTIPTKALPNPPTPKTSENEAAEVVKPEEGDDTPKAQLTFEERRNKARQDRAKLVGHRFAYDYHAPDPNVALFQREYGSENKHLPYLFSQQELSAQMLAQSSEGTVSDIRALTNAVGITVSGSEYTTTPLIQAVQSGNLAVARYLLVKGLDVHAVDQHGYSANDYAHASKQQAMLQLLALFRGKTP
jgi:hypothetical protein